MQPLDSSIFKIEGRGWCHDWGSRVKGSVTSTFRLLGIRILWLCAAFQSLRVILFLNASLVPKSNSCGAKNLIFNKDFSMLSSSLFLSVVVSIQSKLALRDLRDSLSSRRTRIYPRSYLSFSTEFLHWCAFR